MELNLDPEAINRYVAEKIAESAIGDALKKVIDEEVSKLGKSWDNPLKPLVQDALRQVAYEYLATPDVRTQLQTIVHAKLTDDVITEAANKISLSVY